MHTRCLALMFVIAVVVEPASDRAGAQAQPVSAPADLLILNGKVYPGDGAGFTQAVAVRGPRIVAVGTSEDLARLRGSNTQVIDAHGGAVMPGFNDAHAHMLSGGLEKENVNLDEAHTLNEVQSRIRLFSVAHADRSWIRGRGWAYEPFGDGLPTRQQLDAVVSDRPAVMRCYDGHSVWVNSRALALAGITRDTADPPNGTIVRDPETGEPTGLLKESSASLVTRLMPKPTREEQRRGLRAAIADGLKVGVTSVTEASGTPEDFEVFDEARRAGDLSARVYYALLVTPGFTQTDADRFDAVWKAHPDTPLLKTGIVKMFMDGVIETNTAVMLAPYVNVPITGEPNYAREAFNTIVQMMDRRGWQIMVHAIGDGAVRMVLDGFERVAAIGPAPARGRRHRIEHIETVDLADVPRFGTLGVIASMHPVSGFTPPGRPAPTPPGGAVDVWAGNLGPERAARGGLWKSISESGGRVVFGSDWPVATIDAMGRVTHIVNQGQGAVGTDQRLSMTAAIDRYTSGPAYATFDEKEKGTLAPGMLADIVVMATDVFANPPASRADIAVQATVFDGRVVYRAAAAR